MKTHIKNLFVLPVLVAVLVMSALGAQAAVVLTTLYSFSGTNDGATPTAALVQGSDGSLYGTTSGGGGTTNENPNGTYGSGTVFKITTNGMLTTLYSFTGTNDGETPNGLVQGSDGSFFGTTAFGGTKGDGTVFKISTNGVLTTLYSFTGTHDGANPYAGLVQSSDGNFYGTTWNGGTTNYTGWWWRGTYGFGTVFKISANGVLTTLYRFGSIQNTNGVALDGANPYAGLVQGSDGNFYGTTFGGGTNYNADYDLPYGYGTVFKISTNGVLSSVCSFTGGYYGPSGLVQSSDGNFYGIIGAGEAPFGRLGGIFQISTNGALTILYSGDLYSYILGQGSDGDFYGTTSGRGFSTFGNVFKFSLNGALTILYSFGSVQDADNVPLDGDGPNGLLQGSDGNFYGTTCWGGTNGAGTVFRLTVLPQPQLTLIPSGPYVILTWATNFTGFTLESTTNLGSTPGWSPVYEKPVVIGGQNAVVTPISGTQQFFRLSQ